jgi:hypothetical protein
MTFLDNREHLAKRGPDHPVELRPLRVQWVAIAEASYVEASKRKEM